PTRVHLATLCVLARWTRVDLAILRFTGDISPCHPSVRATDMTIIKRVTDMLIISYGSELRKLGFKCLKLTRTEYNTEKLE
uniref:Uncharacterized protein n=1 Tax=Romanomermis culicivorax TaxID=13658 RepID=A0A915IYY8_ROMCU